MKVNLSGRPQVVGVLSSFDGDATAACDLVEIRLDRMKPPPDWLQRCEAIEKRGKPVLLTIRLRSEGGEWAEDNLARFALYEQALNVVSLVDVELASAIC